jgi:hypothetical protein
VSVYSSSKRQIAEYGQFKVGGTILQEAAVPQKPKLLDSVRQTLRLKQYSYRTAQSFLGWIKRFILFDPILYPFPTSVNKGYTLSRSNDE